MRHLLDDVTLVACATQTIEFASSNFVGGASEKSVSPENNSCRGALDPQARDP